MTHLNKNMRRYIILGAISVLTVAVLDVLLIIECRNNYIDSDLLRSRERQLFDYKPWNRARIEFEIEAAYESIGKLWDIHKSDEALLLDQMIALMDPASLAVRYPSRFCMLREDPKVICYFAEGVDLRPRSISDIFDMIPYNNKIEVILVVDENKNIVASKGLVSPSTVGDIDSDFYNRWK